MRKCALVLLAAVLAQSLSLGGPAAAKVRDDDNEARAVTTSDGASRYDVAMSVRRIADSEVTPTNQALAYASCESCRAVAVAFQVVLAVGPVDTVAASNTATAVNDHCQGCETFAAAYQFVVVTGAPVRFTRAGWRAIISIRRALRSLRRSGLPLAELRDQVASLAGRLQQVVTTELRSSRSSRLRASMSRLQVDLPGSHRRPSDRGERQETREHARAHPAPWR